MLIVAVSFRMLTFQENPFDSVRRAAAFLKVKDFLNSKLRVGKAHLIKLPSLRQNILCQHFTHFGKLGLYNSRTAVQVAFSISNGKTVIWAAFTFYSWLWRKQKREGKDWL